MCIHGLEDIYSSREQDTKVAVTTVRVAQILEECGRIATLELILGYSARVVLGVLVEVGTQGLGCLETVESAIVPVDDIDHRCHTSQDDGYLPVALVEGLSSAGEDQ